MPELRPLDLSPAGLAAIAAFLRLVFPHAAHLDPAYLEWIYNGNPAGCAFGCNAFEDGVLVAHHGNIPYRARVDGRAERGALVVHVSTHPAHARKGLYLATTERSCEIATAAGYGFLMGIANARSSFGLVKHLGWQHVGALDARLGVGGGEPAPPSDHFERSWDAESLRWRLANPARSYAAVRRGDTVALYADTGRLGIQAELCALPASLLPEDLPALRSANPLRIWLGLDPGRRTQPGLWIDVPVRLRPAPLHFMFRDLRGGGRQLERGRVLWRAIDFDAY